MEKRAKASWGTYSMVFWGFYESQDRKMEKEYSSTADAARAQRAMLTVMGRKGIHDVRVSRRGNVLHLEKAEVGR